MWSFRGYFLKVRIFLEGPINVDSKDQDILQGPINIEFEGFFEDMDIFCGFFKDFILNHDISGKTNNRGFQRIFLKVRLFWERKF